MNATKLPKLKKEAQEKIKQALKEAQARLRNAVVERAREAKLTPTSIKKKPKNWKTLLRNSAAVHYFDAMAWEFMVSMPAEFDALIEEIAETANRKFKGASQSVRDRKQEWLIEAKERAAQGILGEGIPLRIDSKQLPVFRELQIKFSDLAKSGQELYALFAGSGQKHIVSDGPHDPQRGEFQHKQFNQLARQAMAALGFRFNPSRAVDYWLDLLRQENPRCFKHLRISGLYVASAEFCGELATRALETAAAESALLEHAGLQEIRPGLKCSSVATRSNLINGTQAQPSQPSDSKNITSENSGSLDWPAIEISFLSDERIQVRNGATSETYNYAEFGFADGRVKHGSPKPNLAWVTLRTMAQQNGIIRDGSSTGGWTQVEKRIQDIRKTLKNRFGITGDPIRFAKGTGYRALFKINCSPSFET